MQNKRQSLPNNNLFSTKMLSNLTAGLTVTEHRGAHTYVENKSGDWVCRCGVKLAQKKEPIADETV